MHHILTSALILLSLSYSQGRIKCGLPEAHEHQVLRRTDQPVNQTEYLSPAGLFYVHYDTTTVLDNSGNIVDHRPLAGDADNNGIPDYVEAVAEMADSTYHVLVDIMGYDSQPPDEDGIYDVFLRDDLNPSWYGVTYWNDNLNNGSSWIIIDNDFSEEEGFYTTGYDAMHVTMSHEFFHAIQFGYSGWTNGNVFFYEMSSTWLEDVVAPDVNDYISLRFNFFSHPDRSLDSSSGYSVALYLHYLSLVIEGVDSEFENTIVRSFWNNFRSASHHDAMVSIENVLPTQWGNSFINTWLDFVTLNLYNNIYEDFYYFGDQALIGPIDTDPVPLHTNTQFSLGTDTNSAALKSYQITTSNVRLEILMLGLNTTGYVAVVSSTPERNRIYTADVLIETDVLQPGDQVHFVMGNSVSDNGDVDVEINLYYTPNPPENLIAESYQDSILLRWQVPPQSGVIIDYKILKEWPDSLTGELYTTEFIVEDTVFTDYQVLGDNRYTYRVSARNTAGYSDFSTPATVTSWPDEEDVSSMKLISVYPNPFVANDGIPVKIEFDNGRDRDNLSIQLINLAGQRIYTVPLPFMARGRHRIELADVHGRNIPSGIYFIRITGHSAKSIGRKITIIH